MSVQATTPRRTQQSASFAELFTPKLVTVLREGYSLANLRTDAISGLTVAIVALPLSMAIAIASGATPAQGLYTAIAGGFFVSALGGSRFQIGGPAAAPFLDSTGANVIEGLARRAHRRGVHLYVAGANAGIRRTLHTHGVRTPPVGFASSVEEALSLNRKTPAD